MDLTLINSEAQECTKCWKEALVAEPEALSGLVINDHFAIHFLTILT